MDVIEVDGIEGVLAFDGRVLEFFHSDNRSDSSRLHIRTISRVEIEQRRGEVLFKAHTTKHYLGVRVADEQRAVLDHLRTAVEGALAASG